MKRILFSMALLALVTNSAMGATTVSWISPADGTCFPIGTIVNPTGVASGIGGQGGTGLDLALVIDESGSMGGTPLAQAKAAAIALVDALPQPTSAVSVVGFDSSSHTYRQLTQLTTDKNLVLNAINGIGAGGGTNVGAGVSAGTATLINPAFATAGRAKMMVVLSDGYGAYSGQAATAYASHGIVTHTVGIPGHNASLMAQVAADGHGTYTPSSLAGLIALFNGTGGNLVGLDHVDISGAVTINDIATDTLGNFTLPNYVMTAGSHTFTATAYGTDGTSASADLTLCAVPVPGAALLGMLGLGVASATLRRRRS